MRQWRFMDYHTEDAGNLITPWYASVNDKVRAAFDGVLDTLANTKDWDDPDLYEFKNFVTGEFVGLAELRFSIKEKHTVKRRFRPLGIWRPQDREFILILVCEKSGRMKIPPNAFELAMEYKRQFDQGRGMLYEHV
jgi:hypothetical protein